MEELKHRIIFAPMLEIYDDSPDTYTEVYTDTSTKVLGTVLLQKFTVAKHFYPVAYYSKKYKNT